MPDRELAGESARNPHERDPSCGFVREPLTDALAELSAATTAYLAAAQEALARLQTDARRRSLRSV